MSDSQSLVTQNKKEEKTLIRIAICDDDVYFTSCLEELILDYNDLYKFDCNIYFDGATLKEAIRQGERFDLIFLDIEMERMDGIQAAKYVREMDENVTIYFISSHESYMKELFSVQPKGFLTKPLLPEQLRSCLNEAIKEIEEKAEYFSYTSDYMEHRVPLKDIIYFESKGRKVYIYMRNQIDSFYGKISDVQERISASAIAFIRIHQSFLVNYRYIYGYNTAKIELENGIILPVSAERKKEVCRQYHILTETRQ